MAVTSTNTFTVTRDDVIKAALRTLGAIGAGEPISTEDYTNCSQALNIMIKAWAKKGIPLWTTDELILPLVNGQLKYPLGPGAGYLETNGIIVTNGGSGGTDGTYALTITDAGGGTGAVGTYTILGGKVTTIAITSPGSSYKTPVLTFPLGSVTGVQYTLRVTGLTVSRPLGVIEAFIRYGNGIDKKCTTISRSEYNTLGLKSSGGNPNLYYYDNQIEQSHIHVFNVPTDNTISLYMQIQRQFYDMTSGTDSFDFPQEWFQALKWGLASEISMEYAIDKELIPYFENKASKMLQESFDESVEDASVFFTYRNN